MGLTGNPATTMISCIHDFGEKLCHEVQSDEGSATIAGFMITNVLESMLEDIRELNPNAPVVEAKAQELWQLDTAAVRSVPCLFSDVQAGIECATGMVNLMCGKLGVGLSDESFQKFC